MHKISIQSIQKLASEIEKWESQNGTTAILKKARELYEMCILFHHQGEIETEKTKDVLFGNIDEIVSKEEFIFGIDKEVLAEKKVEEIEKPTETVEPDQTTLFKEEPLSFSESPQESAQDIIQAPDPLSKVKKSMPQLSMEEEMKSSVSGLFAADLFENAEKINSIKKSLNDKLSQKQIQIGLNDRIAFVKHLFKGNLEDFNRVISQLNTFETVEQAKDFINQLVKPDYQWEAESEYELRLLQLIERKFL